MKAFHLVRIEDKSGVSGTGIVAEGVVFPSGRVAMEWLGAVSSLVVHDSIEHVELIHGHSGASYIEWLPAKEQG